MMGKVLTPEAEAERDAFEQEYDDGNCSCHISPPCGSCTHPGNPRNQAEDESCWMDEPPAPPANERHLVSRNKREGWYAGKDGWSKGQHHRTRERGGALRWAIGWPSDLIWIDESNDLARDSYVVIVHSDYAKWGPICHT